MTSLIMVIMVDILWEFIEILILPKGLILGLYFPLSETLWDPRGLWWVILMRFFVNQKKGGGQDMPSIQMEAFRKVLSYCELRDLGFKSPLYLPSVIIEMDLIEFMKY